jgi:hypothetical protein
MLNVMKACEERITDSCTHIIVLNVRKIIVDSLIDQISEMYTQYPICLTTWTFSRLNVENGAQLLNLQDQTVQGLLDPEDGVTTLLRNVGNRLPVDMA